MLLKYESNNFETKVLSYNGVHLLGIIRPITIVRREKTIEFVGMATVLYYDSVEEAKEKLPTDLANYLKELMNEQVFKK